MDKARCSPLVGRPEDREHPEQKEPTLLGLLWGEGGDHCNTFLAGTF